MRRTTPVEPSEPSEPVEPAPPLSHVIKGQHAQWANPEPLIFYSFSKIEYTCKRYISF